MFAESFCEYLKKIEWMTSNWFLVLMRPFWGKATNKMFRGFIRPLIKGYTRNMDEGINYVTYDAPAAIYFYGSPYADPADPIIPATYAMLAAESLGLATCIIGGVHPFIQSGKAARKFREKHNIRFKSKEGVILLLGYPKYKYKKGISRTFANIDHGRLHEYYSCS
jgi:nitroreductase